MKLAAALAVPRQRPDWLRFKLPSFIALIVLWQVSAVLIADPVFPTPWATLESGYVHLMAGDLLFSLAVTLARVAVAFLFAMVIGSAIGIALGRSQPMDAIFGDWLSIALNMPALVTIVLCYVWIGLNETAAIVAVTINKAPTVAAITREGARALDRQLLEMTHVFGVSRWKVLRHIVLPQLAPSFIASARAGLALTWKIVLVVEWLGRPNGVGFQIHTFFTYFDIASIVAYSLAFIGIVLAIESFIVQPLERRTGRWRTA